MKEKQTQLFNRKWYWSKFLSKEGWIKLPQVSLRFTSCLIFFSKGGPLSCSPATIADSSDSCLITSCRSSTRWVGVWGWKEETLHASPRTSLCTNIKATFIIVSFLPASSKDRIWFPELQVRFWMEWVFSESSPISTSWLREFWNFRKREKNFKGTCLEILAPYKNTCIQATTAIRLWKIFSSNHILHFSFLEEHLFNCDKAEWLCLKKKLESMWMTISHLWSYSVKVLLQTKKNLNVLEHISTGSIQLPRTLVVCKPEKVNPSESVNKMRLQTYTWFSFWVLNVWSLWNGVETAILWPHTGVEVSAGLSRFRFSWLDEVFKNCRQEEEKSARPSRLQGWLLKLTLLNRRKRNHFSLTAASKSPLSTIRVGACGVPDYVTKLYSGRSTHEAKTSISGVGNYKQNDTLSQSETFSITSREKS